MNHGWEKKRLGDICQINFGKRIVAKDTQPGPYYVYGGGGATFTTMDYNREDCIIVSRFAMSPECVRFVRGRFFLNDSGLSVNSIKDFLTQAFVDKYLWAIQPKIYNLGRGAAQKNLNTKSFSELTIPLPAVNIQHKIVSEIDKLNELIEIKRSQLKDLDALAQSLFYEIFGDPLENSKKWNVGTLSEYANFKNGLNFTPADDGNKIKCLGVGDFKSNRYIKAENLPEINIVEAVSEEYLLKDGDIILVRSNGNKALIGRSIMYVSNNSLATFSGFCIRCRYNRETLAPLFLSYYLSCSAIREYITSQGRGCNISNLNQKILSDIPLILPPLSLQNEFAKKIEAIEKQKRLIESLIADLETLLASRMDYWFNEI